MADVKAAHIETIPGSKLKKQDTSHSRKFVVPPNGKPLSGSAKAKKRIVSVLNEISKRFKKRGEKYKLILKSVLDQLSVRDNLSVDLSLADKVKRLNFLNLFQLADLWMPKTMWFFKSYSK